MATEPQLPEGWTRPRLTVTVDAHQHDGRTVRAVFDLGTDAHLSTPIDALDVTPPGAKGVCRDLGEWMHFSVSGALRRADFEGWHLVELECDGARGEVSGG